MRVVKLNKLNTNILIAVTATVLLLTHLGEAGAVSAAPDQYDPRRDPNYSREAFQTAPIHWEAVWGLVREFETRTHSNMGRSRPSSQFAFPQPWHYVQESLAPGATLPFSGAAIYGGAYGGPSYGYDSWSRGWWETSPRIPWWSLIPFKKDHHRPRPHHEGMGRW
jgi:hypothetical protein